MHTAHVCVEHVLRLQPVSLPFASFFFFIFFVDCSALCSVVLHLRRCAPPTGVCMRMCAVFVYALKRGHVHHRKGYEWETKRNAKQKPVFAFCNFQRYDFAVAVSVVIVRRSLHLSHSISLEYVPIACSRCSHIRATEAKDGDDDDDEARETEKRLVSSSSVHRYFLHRNTKTLEHSRVVSNLLLLYT